MGHNKTYLVASIGQPKLFRIIEVAVVEGQTIVPAIHLFMQNYSGVQGILVDASRVGVVVQGARKDRVACFMEGKHGVFVCVVEGVVTF